MASSEESPLLRSVSCTFSIRVCLTWSRLAYSTNELPWRATSTTDSFKPRNSGSGNAWKVSVRPDERLGNSEENSASVVVVFTFSPLKYTRVLTSAATGGGVGGEGVPAWGS